MGEFEIKLSSNLRNLEILKTFIDEISHINSNLQDNMLDMNLKVQDFSIYNLFKSVAETKGTTETGVISTDASIVLVENLEKKFFKILENINEKLKKSEEDSYKLRNDNSNNKINLENLTERLNQLKEDNSNYKKTEKTLKDLIYEKYEEMDIKLTETTDVMSENFQKELKRIIKLRIEKPVENNEEEDDNNKKKIALKVNNPQPDSKMLKDCVKKTLEIEKTLKLFINSVNVEQIRAELNKLNEALSIRLTKYDILDMKENLSKLFVKKKFIFKFFYR